MQGPPKGSHPAAPGSQSGALPRGARGALAQGLSSLQDSGELPAREQGQPGTHEVRAAFFSHFALDVEMRRARTPG